MARCRYAKSVAQAERAVRGALEWCQLGHRVFHEVNQRMVTHVWKLFYFQLLKPPEREVCSVTDAQGLLHVSPSHSVAHRRAPAHLCPLCDPVAAAPELRDQ